MAAPTYAELLHHPEWQKKRLKIMERDGFACALCGAEDRTLNVHHRYYTKGAKPWEYPDAHLDCLCETCHGEEHARREELKLLAGRLGPHSTESLVGLAKALVMQREPAARFRPDDHGALIGMAALYGITGRCSLTRILDAAAAAPDGALSGADLRRVRAEQEAFLDEERAARAAAWADPTTTLLAGRDDG